MKASCDCCREADDAPCGCCEGIEIKTPLPIYNRPGLGQLAYRIGTHSAFFESMQARLSGLALENTDAEGKPIRTYPLARLTTRDPGDPSIALLDAWATAADVLTFYQERIANENYLRTATERRSIVELAALAGYRPRPGVSASVFLAYTIDANTAGEVVIPAGSRSQSMPGPGEMPQPFETSDDLKTRAAWNDLKPRLARGQTEQSITKGDRVYLQGINTNLSKNDALLVDFGSGTPVFKRVAEVVPDNKADRTLVRFAPPIVAPLNALPAFNLIYQLVLPASIQPANRFQLRQDLRSQFAVPAKAVSQSPGLDGAFSTEPPANTLLRPSAQAGYAVLNAFSPVLGRHFGAADASIQLTERPIKVYALRAKASLFGHNAPRAPQYKQNIIQDQPWPEWKYDGSEAKDTLYLDRAYKEVADGDLIAVQLGNQEPIVYNIDSAQNLSRSVYGISGETTRITVNNASLWNPDPKNEISSIRTTTLYTQPEMLELADEPIENAVCGGTGDPIELDGFYEGLEAGRWVIVSGEREIDGTRGVRFSELAVLSSVSQSIASSGNKSVPLPGEKRHTYIKLAEKLAYCFRRDSVAIHGNVINATHGETRIEVLGSGNGGKALQKFTLKQAPLTYVSAANPSGIDSTLTVFVNQIEWQEADALAGLGPTDRRFTTQTGDDGKTTVIFGNGGQGARLPTGIENIRAEYRSGIGKPGNVKAEQISLLLTKPLGVKEVINPLRASGGADRETRDQARKNVPLAVKALDRLVSTQDYEDFSRLFAGIGKAYAVELSDGRRPLVHVTIAGAADAPIDVNSDLYRNLRKSLHDFGDPLQKITLAVRELLLIVIEARIAILPAYRWETVVADVRAALLDAFGFERREIGQDVVLSEVIGVMQAVTGVAYVDVDAFGGVPEKQPFTQKEIKEVTNDGELPLADTRRFLTTDEISDEVAKISWRIQGLDEAQLQTLAEAGPLRVPQRVKVGVPTPGDLRPAQLAFLSPDVPATLILNQIK